MSNLGLVLKQAREQKQLSLHQVENETNIRLAYLMALEDGNYDELPGRVYGIGFLRSYAKYLGLDPIPLIAELKHDWKDTVEEVPAATTEEEKDFSGPKASNTVKLAGYGLAVAAVAGLIFLSANLPKDNPGPPEKPSLQAEKEPIKENTPPAVIDSNSTQTPSSSAPLESPASGEPQANRTDTTPTTATDESASKPAEAQPAASITPEISPASQAPATDGVAVTFRVVQDRCWMAVTQDDVPAYTGTLSVGETMTFTGKNKVYIHAGNAGAVEVIYNGQNLGTLGDLNKVVTKEFVRS
ncbi:helix-turn-helix domain-containing protein [Heliobacterium chlorum]|uniref:Helix-turn-helix domain-containing protein n=1 Tax=Heliobacterium chlorum TaxID=2698 RepID=A0ABR7T5T7_HELCL|nr:RodZ domain-containing protein [Heliobacterium chlorum]MBC9786016.1 helix-turn-helix domain-containing protein [Heliobacterium chlorum]